MQGCVVAAIEKPAAGGTHGGDPKRHGCAVDVYNSWLSPPYHNTPLTAETFIARWHDLPKAGPERRLPLMVSTGTHGGSATEMSEPGWHGARRHVRGELVDERPGARRPAPRAGAAHPPAPVAAGLHELLAGSLARRRRPRRRREGRRHQPLPALGAPDDPRRAHALGRHAPPARRLPLPALHERPDAAPLPTLPRRARRPLHLDEHRRRRQAHPVRHRHGRPVGPRDHREAHPYQGRLPRGDRKSEVTARRLRRRPVCLPGPRGQRRRRCRWESAPGASILAVRPRGTPAACSGREERRRA